MIINVTENDIVRAMNNHKNNPVQVAVARILNVNLGDVDYDGTDRIYVWYEDEIDHTTYIADDENLERFMDAWDDFAEDGIDFNEAAFEFSAEERKCSPLS